MSAERLALGTVQFGLPYGVSNRHGQVSFSEVAAILKTAQEAGVDTLDTAIAYGDSEERIGQIGVRNWKVVTKLPGIPAECPSVEYWIEESVADSLKRLQVNQLYGLLLHRPTDLLGPFGGTLYKALQTLQEQGWVSKLGVSIYEPEELEKIYPRFPLNLVQAPFNGLDQRLAESGWLARLKQDGVEVHSRSLFLQGLLLMPTAQRPPQFSRWQSLWEAWDSWLAAHQVSPLQACLGCAWHQPDLDRILVGVDGRSQLQEIIGAIDGDLPSWPGHIKTDDLDLLNPARWALS